jgi:hypothetical protein
VGESVGKLDLTRGALIADRYEVIERLDHSPLGVSYRATDTKSAQSVRLLVCDNASHTTDRLGEAFETAKRLHHERLPAVHDMGRHGDLSWVTMDDFQGVTLRELLQQHRVQGVQLALREAAAITNQILDALRAVHDAGHELRSLRPEYIVVNARRAGPRGANLVADVRVLYAGLWDIVPVGVLAEDEFNRGEAQYLAPELKSFNPKPSPRCDIYSVGVIFYELLVGAAPTGTFQLPRQRRPELPALVDEICASSLANAPEDRYASARDFASALQGVARAQSQEPDDELPVRTSIHPMIWVLAGTLVLAIAALLYRSSGDPREAALAADNALRNRVSAAYAARDLGAEAAILASQPPNMMLVPAGPYVAGRLDQEQGVGAAEPRSEVRELPAFLIDVFEHPNLKDAPPTTKVTFAEAEKLCGDQGKRLCSADEMEKACKGPSNRIYGYDDAFSFGTCGNGVEDTHASGQKSDCKSGWGVYDIAGNFREWTATTKGDGRPIVKGGLPDTPAVGTRCAFQTDLSKAYTDATLSFRCCKSIP